MTGRVGKAEIGFLVAVTLGHLLIVGILVYAVRGTFWSRPPEKPAFIMLGNVQNSPVSAPETQPPLTRMPMDIDISPPDYEVDNPSVPAGAAFDPFAGAALSRPTYKPTIQEHWNERALEPDPKLS